MAMKAAMTTGMEMTAKEHIKGPIFLFFTYFTTSGVFLSY